MTYAVGDKVYILHDHSREFHLGTVTGITPTGRINVNSICFTGRQAQFNKDGTLRGVDHHGGTHIVPVPEGTSTEHLDREELEKADWLFGAYVKAYLQILEGVDGYVTEH